MRTSTKIAVTGVAALVAVLPATAAQADRASNGPVRVSRGDPFASCTVGSTPTSVLYPGAEVEPSVATDPVRASRVVGVWQQDRWNDGGAHGLVAGFSSDGGQTFHEVPWPVSTCAGGLDYQRASDPWVSIGPDGTVYGSALSFDADTPRNAVVATTSYDGGRTWRNTTPVIADTALEFFNDKNSVTADPVRVGSAYQVWDRFTTDAAGLFVSSPAMISITRDFGRTWSAPRAIVQPAQFGLTIGNIVVADPRSGVLYNFYETTQFTDANLTDVVFTRFEVVRSTDGGRTWSRPSVVANDTAVFDVDPNTGAELRTGAGLPSPAIDPRTGELYVAYEGTDFTGGAYNQVQLVHSTDGGRTWSAPSRVNGDPRVSAFTPIVAVASDGTVGVTYYDLRTLRPNNTTTLPTSTWLTVSPRGGRHFGRERQIAPVFDFLQAPFAGGYFIGDYEGLVTFDGLFRALFVTANSGQPNNRTDVQFGQFRPGQVGESADTTGAAPARPATARGPAVLAQLPRGLRH